MKLPIVFDNEAEWLQARNAKIGGTRISALLSDAKREMTEDELADLKKRDPKSKAKLIVDDSLLSAAAMNMLDEVIAEIYTEQGKFVPLNYAMERGKDLEPEAFSEFCKIMGWDINDPDILHFGVTCHALYVENKYASSSPDGLIKFAKAIVEIKCEGSDKHLKYLRINSGDELRKLEPDHYEQLQYNILLGEADRGYFISYDDRYKRESLRIKAIEVDRDGELHARMINKLDAAMNYIIKEIAFLDGLN